MTLFELKHALLRWADHPLHQYVHRRLRALSPALMLDVGGRRSHYTVGLPAVWISDVPRERDIQRQLDLGATDAIRSAVLRNRSNVREYVYDDMTRTGLPAESFDVVNAVEVLEHVEEDEEFIANVAKVLRPGGYFLMTTPNGDWKPVPYPDHKRHYRAADLERLLLRYFRNVRVEYRVNAGGLFDIGYRFGLLGAWAHALNALLERLGLGGDGPHEKHHLFAVCQK